MTEKIDIVIVHKPCRDGYTAGLCAYKYYQIENAKPNAIIQNFEIWGAEPNKHTCLKTLTEKATEFIESGKVVNTIRIFDLAVEPAVLNMLAAKLSCTDIQVHDHHKTFYETWAEYKKTDPQMYSMWEDKLFYDVTHSGAYLAWKYYFPDEPVPLYVLYVEDRDIWQFKQPASMEIGEALFNNEIRNDDPIKYLETYFNFPNQIEEQKYFDSLEQIGKSLVNAKNKRMDSLYRTGYFIEFDGHRIWACNASHNDASDLGNLAVTKGDCAAAFIWRYIPENNTIGISTRSNNKDPNAIDVSQLCKNHGGGGHFHAAGFEIPVDQIGTILNRLL